MAIEHAGDRIAPSWRFALSLLGGVRRWLFLPTLAATAPYLVTVKGGDALSVCFNTIAVLFLCEIDNLAFAVFLPERLHAWVEDEGRVELGEAEAKALMLSKMVHVPVLVVVVPCAVAAGGSGAPDIELWSLFLPQLAFWVAGGTEAALGAASAREACVEVGKVTGKWLLGFFGYFVMFKAYHAGM
jgi:hypothetical protein